jgi:hypothetical protein
MLWCGAGQANPRTRQRYGVHGSWSGAGQAGRAVVGSGVHAVRPAVALARSGRRQHRAAAVAAQRKAAAVRGIQKQQLADRAAPGQGRVV